MAPRDPQRWWRGGVVEGSRLLVLSAPAAPVVVHPHRVCERTAAVSRDRGHDQARWLVGAVRHLGVDDRPAIVVGGGQVWIADEVHLSGREWHRPATEKPRVAAVAVGPCALAWRLPDVLGPRPAQVRHAVVVEAHHHGLVGRSLVQRPHDRGLARRVHACGVDGGHRWGMGGDANLSTQRRRFRLAGRRPQRG